MKTILLATDYSPAARHAAVYASYLAQYLNVELHLFHAYVIPFSYTDSPVPLLNVEEVVEIANQSMEAELKYLQALTPNISITGSVMPGDIIDCLEERIKNHKPDLVVVGTSGAGGDSFLWGSMAVKALRNLTVPVLAIPMDASWKEVKHICFAADYKNIDKQFPVNTVIDWVKRLDAKLSIVHIDKPGQHEPAKETFQQMMATVSPDYHTIINEQISDGINDYMERNPADWVMIIPKKYGFFENLFHKSRTEILTKASKIPILALH
jgi:nucleotide-binding universal stress UspA family protein